MRDTVICNRVMSWSKKQSTLELELLREIDLRRILLEQEIFLLKQENQNCLFNYNSMLKKPGIMLSTLRGVFFFLLNKTYINTKKRAETNRSRGRGET